MNKEKFMKIKQGLDRKAADKRREKEREYFSEYDVLSNLRKIASFRNKETPSMITDLLAKQLVSISDMVDINQWEDFTKEQWDEKFVDILNYTYKLYASIME